MEDSNKMLAFWGVAHLVEKTRVNYNSKFNFKIISTHSFHHNNQIISPIGPQDRKGESGGENRETTL